MVTAGTCCLGWKALKSQLALSHCRQVQRVQTVLLLGLLPNGRCASPQFLKKPDGVGHLGKGLARQPSGQHSEKQASTQALALTRTPVVCFTILRRMRPEQQKTVCHAHGLCLAQTLRQRCFLCLIEGSAIE